MKKHNLRNIRLRIIAVLTVLATLVPGVSHAHCPLCTVGAGVLAVTAAALGVSSVAVGIMIGAFALALSLWLARLPKKRYLPFQFQLLTSVIFLTTIIPIMPFIKDYGSIYVSIAGEYGSLLNRTYMYDRFLVGVIIGVIILLIAPYLSSLITKLRHGSQLPWQGLILTFLTLIIASVISQLLL